MLRKFISVLLCAVLLVTSVGIAAAAVPETVQDKLQLIEQDTYGMEQTGALLERLNKLEKDYDGTHRDGSLMARVDALYAELYENEAKPSIMAEMNAIEWNIGHEVSMKPVQKRLTEMETGLMGKSGEGTFRQRIAALTKASFGTEALPLGRIPVPANTLIKIALVDEVNAKDIKVGDVVHIKAADDVVVDGYLLFAKGEPGEGVVTEVRQARNFGRDAKVEIDFKRVKSIDGTEVDTFIGDEAKEEYASYAKAAGAGLAGALLLGPIGVVGAAFVKGKNVKLPAGTELYIQTQKDEMLYGVATTGAE